jgi:hypothetical protein
LVCAAFFMGYFMTLDNYFRDYLHRTDDKVMTKMDHYLDVYHRLLAPWRSQDISF